MKLLSICGGEGGGGVERVKNNYFWWTLKCHKEARVEDPRWM